MFEVLGVGFHINQTTVLYYTNLNAFYDGLDSEALLFIRPIFGSVYLLAHALLDMGSTLAALAFLILAVWVLYRIFPLLVF